jgi:hypothetical protein
LYLQLVESSGTTGGSGRAEEERFETDMSTEEEDFEHVETDAFAMSNVWITIKLVHPASSSNISI